MFDLARRRFVAGGVGAMALPGIARAMAASVHAAATLGHTSPFGVRAIGTPKAPVHVIEYFSLNCPHCAAFAIYTLPAIIRKLVDTGHVYYEFRDFPLNEDALWAAAVARSLPSPEYRPFIMELFKAQRVWAFAPRLHTSKQYAMALEQYAALAGMGKVEFRRVIHSAKLRKFIIAEAEVAQHKYGINATPSFIINGRKHVGAVAFPVFSDWVRQAV